MGIKLKSTRKRKRETIMRKKTENYTIMRKKTENYTRIRTRLEYKRTKTWDREKEQGNQM